MHLYKKFWQALPVLLLSVSLGVTVDNTITKILTTLGSDVVMTLISILLNIR